jgi:hypothetical protein
MSSTRDMLHRQLEAVTAASNDKSITASTTSEPSTEATGRIQGLG